LVVTMDQIWHAAAPFPVCHSVPLLYHALQSTKTSKRYRYDADLGTGGRLGQE
jgi:hypothetical protein